MQISVGVAGLFACTVIFAVLQQTASAEDLNKQLALESVNILKVNKDPEPIPTANLQVEHVVASGESLEKIAAKYSISWQRLFDKNIQLSDPNLINPGAKIVIPNASEQLLKREFSPLKPAIQKKPHSVQPSKSKKANRSLSGGSPGGNTYYAGYCTHYAKQRRPDLPNNLGNANTWVPRARAQGIPTGSVPRAGAIGQKGMHVVYVERVNGDGTIYISDMNWAGRGVITHRTVPADSHQYIY